MKASHHRPPPLWLYIMLVLICLVLLTMAKAARAQGVPPCMSFTATAEALEGKYRETPVGAGLVNEGAAVVLFATASGATWTLVVRKADGETCFLASGSDWVTKAPAPEGKEG